MFINLTVILENTKLADLGVSDEIYAPVRIKVSHIDAYRNYVNDEGEIVETESMIYMENGSSFAVNATLEEIDNKIKEV
jgi:uncharacterized protein YlzI (FlbEa/FlbD family)